MSDQDRSEEISIKTTLPPSPVVSLPELKSPVVDYNDKPIPTIQQDSFQGATSSIAHMTPEERAKRKAMLVTALERGVINDRMSVPLPSHLHGEWVRRDPFEIDNMKRMGFEIDTEYATKRSLHTDGTGAAFVSDVVFMTTTKENKELIDEVKHERFLAVHSKKGKDAEEKAFEQQTRTTTDGIIPTMIESKTRELRKDNIASAMSEMDKQTTPRTP